MLETLYELLMRLVYLVVAPGHPRWRTAMHAVYEDEGGDTLWVHTHGLARLGLPEIELVGVPVALRGYAHGILFEIMGYMKAERAIGPDENFGGMLAHSQQKVIHSATARLIEREDSAHSRFIRFVDYGQSAEAGFPYCLFAAHIASLAEETRSPNERERLAPNQANPRT